MVGEEELRKYRSRFEIPDSVTLMLLGDRVVWNPLENTVAIYGAMLSCGVTLPLQPFIARFLMEAQIAPAQLAPNSYRILMCLCLMWKLKGYGPPTPLEIRHFYTLRQAGNGGTYFLLSSPVENWIPEGVANPRQVEISSDEKKKDFIWGFPTSNKRWKNSWFFVGGEWGRNVPASSRRNLSAKKIPRHFTSPEAWSKAAPVLLDGEISHLATVAVLPLSLRDRSFLLDEEKMIAERVFTRLLARLPRLKNSEAASKRHAVGLAKEEIASPDGDDPSYSEEAGDVTGGGVESRQPPMRTEVAANTPVATTAATTPAVTTPSHKGKEKVGASGGVSDVPIFATDVLETPLDPASDLAPRASKGKRPAEGTPDHAARPPKRASRVVQYVVSSDEEGADEPALAKTPSAPTVVREGPAKGTNTAVPPTRGDQPGPSGRPESVDRPGPSKQPGTSGSSSSVAHEAPSAGPTEVEEGTVSLSNFSSIEICSHLINNDVCIGEDWGHIKGKSCNRKMEFFFNCHFLMMSELAENYKYGNKASREIKHLREQASTLAAEKLSAEESHAQQFAQLRESTDGHLSARLAAEEKLSAAEEEIRLLKEHLSASQESFTARLEAERVAEEAKEKAEHEAQDLRNQLFSRELIFDSLKAVLEAETVDHFKRSPAYDALLLRDFERGMRQSKKFFAMKDHSNEKALRRFDRSLQQHMASRVDSIKEQIK
ncbi:hypothetical protein LWI29_006810 [Acer saccharum]|uniref:Uncharacterized protein n=1 Tax=Acer saccharum TaxID=4024 RepID=A0AA39RBZ8_ACESA|nr:hypothetical protein LWI29_006810 [Acer saccharum]